MYDRPVPGHRGTGTYNVAPRSSNFGKSFEFSNIFNKTMFKDSTMQGAARQ